MTSQSELPFLSNDIQIPMMLDVQEWSDKIKKMFNMNISMEKPNESLLLTYNKLLTEQLKVCRDRPFLRQEVFRHIKFFYIYYFESNSNISNDLYELMEFVLTIHCSIEIEATQMPMDNKIGIENVENVCRIEPLRRRLLRLLLIFYDDRRQHILHVLLGVKYNTRSPTNRHDMVYIIGNVLTELQIDVFDGEVFCAAYILFYKLLEILPPKRREAATKWFQLRFKENLKQMEKTSIGRTILKMRQRHNNRSIVELYCPKSNATSKYFNHIRHRNEENSGSTSIPVEILSDSEEVQTNNCFITKKRIFIDPIIDVSEESSDGCVEVVEIVSGDEECEATTSPIKKSKKRRKRGIRKNSIINLCDESVDDSVCNDQNSLSKNVRKGSSKKHAVMSENQSVHSSVKRPDDTSLQANINDTHLTDPTPIIDDDIVCIGNDTVNKDNNIQTKTGVIKSSQVNDISSVLNKEKSKSSIVNNVQEYSDSLNFETSDCLKSTDVISLNNVCEAKNDDAKSTENKGVQVLINNGDLNESAKCKKPKINSVVNAIRDDIVHTESASTQTDNVEILQENNSSVFINNVDVTTPKSILVTKRRGEKRKGKECCPSSLQTKRPSLENIDSGKAIQTPLPYEWTSNEDNNENGQIKVDKAWDQMNRQTEEEFDKAMDKLDELLPSFPCSDVFTKLSVAEAKKTTTCIKTLLEIMKNRRKNRSVPANNSCDDNKQSQLTFSNSTEQGNSISDLETCKKSGTVNHSQTRSNYANQSHLNNDFPTYYSHIPTNNSITTNNPHPVNVVKHQPISNNVLNLTRPSQVQESDLFNEFSNSPKFDADLKQVEYCMNSDETNEILESVLLASNNITPLLSDHSNFYTNPSNHSQVTEEVPSSEDDIELDREILKELNKYSSDDEIELNQTLPFKKRRVSTTSFKEPMREENRRNEEEISYPAAPMISITELIAQQTNNNRRPIRTAAERKEVLPSINNLTVPYVVPHSFDSFTPSPYSNFNFPTVPVVPLMPFRSSYPSYPMPLMLPYNKLSGFSNCADKINMPSTKGLRTSKRNKTKQPETLLRIPMRREMPSTSTNLFAPPTCTRVQIPTNDKLMKNVEESKVTPQEIDMGEIETVDNNMRITWN